MDNNDGIFQEFRKVAKFTIEGEIKDGKSLESYIIQPNETLEKLNKFKEEFNNKLNVFINENYESKILIIDNEIKSLEIEIECGKIRALELFKLFPAWDILKTTYLHYELYLKYLLEIKEKLKSENSNSKHNIDKNIDAEIAKRLQNAIHYEKNKQKLLDGKKLSIDIEKINIKDGKIPIDKKESCYFIYAYCKLQKDKFDTSNITEYIEQIRLKSNISIDKKSIKREILHYNNFLTNKPATQTKNIDKKPQITQKYYKSLLELTGD